MKKIFLRNILFTLLSFFGTFIALAQTGARYGTEQQAARAFVDEYNGDSIAFNVEIGSPIYHDAGGYYFSDAQHVSVGTAHNIPRVAYLKGHNATGFVHTHGADSGSKYNDYELSPGDINYGNNRGINIYAGFPNNNMGSYNPSSCMVNCNANPGYNGPSEYYEIN